MVELLSPTDRLTDTMRKMEHWLEAGAKLGWLIAPGTESVYIFEPGQPVRPIVGFDQELTMGRTGWPGSPSWASTRSSRLVWCCPASRWSGAGCGRSKPTQNRTSCRAQPKPDRFY